MASLRIEVSPKSGDKNFGIEIFNQSPCSFSDLHFFPAEIIRRDQLKEGKFFVQCNSRDYIFLESWQDDEEKVLQAAEYLERAF